MHAAPTSGPPGRAGVDTASFRTVQSRGAGRRAGALAILVMATFFVGCERELSGVAPPLRPLVYTEAPPEDDVEEPAPPEIPHYIAPEDLGVAIYQALVEHDRELFEQVFVSGPDLVELINAKAQKAERDAKGYIEASDAVWSLFLPGEPSEEPVGGLASRLRLIEFEVGKGRDISGKLARPGDDIVMHWNSSVRMQLHGTDKKFVLRVPKIVKTRSGWKVMGELDVDPTLRTWLEAGMHLKPELLTSEHYPLPLEVGNFWKYRVKYHGPRPPPPRPRPQEQPTDGGEAGDNPDASNPAVAVEPMGDPTVRVTVTDVARREGYLIATLERELRHGAVKVDTYRSLVTPRRVYPCTRDCFARIDDIAYLLGYMAQQTPTYVFPIGPGKTWGKAGRAGGRDPYEVKPERQRAEVPAGDFPAALVIAGSIEEGREERYFVPGTGVVKRTVRSGLGPRTEVLTEYRLML